MNKYNGFHTIDTSSTNNWWMRGIYIPTSYEVGLIVLQDHLGSQFPDMINVGMTVGKDEADAYQSLFDGNFDRTIGESELLIRLESLFMTGDLIDAMLETCTERDCRYLRVAGDPNYEFDKTVLSIMEYHGFGNRTREGALDVLSMEAHERNSN